MNIEGCIPIPKTLNCQGRLIDISVPKIMGILNLTPDSFSDGGLYNSVETALARVEVMLKEGADIIDIGGASSRPGAVEISEEEELKRIYKVTETLIQNFPETIFSIDTYRSRVAEEVLALGVSIVNDISGGTFDKELPKVAAKYHAPYIIMHMKGKPETMQQNPSYENATEEIWKFFIDQINNLQRVGVKDIILDPGFGFGKTTEHNYEIFKSLQMFTALSGFPVMIGISRKALLSRIFDKPLADTLPILSALHLEALKLGVKILRVHDVAAASRIVTLWQALN